MNIDSDETAFVRELDGLKRRGCTLLVVNDAESVSATCRHMLGDSTALRRRLFVPTTTTVASALSRHGPARTANALGVVDATGAETRGVATAPRLGDFDPSAEWYSRVETLDLGVIGSRAMEHLARFELFSPDPAEVRVCLESLDPFLDEEARLFRFLHLLTARIRSLRGIGHVHVSTGVSARQRALLEPLFDATVTVRHAEAGTRQRWLLRDSGYDSGWVDAAGFEPADSSL